MSTMMLLQLIPIYDAVKVDVDDVLVVVDVEEAAPHPGELLSVHGRGEPDVRSRQQVPHRPSRLKDAPGSMEKDLQGSRIEGQGV